MRNKGMIILALAAVIITVLTLRFMNRPVVPKPATIEDVQAEAGRGGYRLIDTQQLRAKCMENRQGVLLVDTRQEWEYRAGHIQGAVNFPMEPTSWDRWRKTGALEKFLGTDRNREVVFY